MLTTKHKNDMVDLQRRSGPIQKPKCIIDYNKGKAFIDTSDQIKSYSNALRKGVKWYRKLAFEILIGTNTVNALYVYKNLSQENISITTFKEQIIQGLTGMNNALPPPPLEPRNPETHCLEDVGRKGRRRCVKCYEKLTNSDGRQVAMRKTPQVKYVCTTCKKNFCLECFLLYINVLFSFL